VALPKLTKRRDDNHGGIDVPLDLVAGAFLGTLPAEDSVAVHLSGVFAEIYNRFESLRSSYFNGEISKTAFGRALSELKCRVADGSEWMLGATSGQWYRRSNATDSWVATPVEQGMVVEEEARQARGRVGGTLQPSLVSPVAAPVLEIPSPVEPETPGLAAAPDDQPAADESHGGYGSYEASGGYGGADL